MMSTFRSLHILNYRIWFIGALISNIGTWMQRTAQDWLVFDHLAAATGLVWIIRAKTLRVRVDRRPRGLPRLRIVLMAGADPRPEQRTAPAGTQARTTPSNADA